MAEKSSENLRECAHDCSSCNQACPSRSGAPAYEKLNRYSTIKKVIGVVSGKGGVGKSMVSSLLATELSRRDNKVAVLDADITGPSIPKAFGLSGNCNASPLGGIEPMTTKTGIEIMSVNLLIEDVTSPVVWRGPVIAGTVKQFWTDVVWGDIDVMIIDCPPGTGDVPLTLFQSIPLDGIVIVTSPQELVEMIVSKAVNMAKIMNIPIVGVVENMSYVVCPDCGKKINVFGDSGAKGIAANNGLCLLAEIPLDKKLASLCDRGMIELFENDYITRAADVVEALPLKERE